MRALLSVSMFKGLHKYKTTFFDVSDTNSEKFAEKEKNTLSRVVNLYCQPT